MNFATDSLAGIVLKLPRVSYPASASLLTGRRWPMFNHRYIRCRARRRSLRKSSSHLRFEAAAMTGKTFEIQVQDDHLQRISQVRKPILAVAELIWNAVDADADCIDVVLHDDNLGGFKTIEVADNGHGIPYQDAEDLFSRLGGSWKQGGHRSHEK